MLDYTHALIIPVQINTKNLDTALPTVKNITGAWIPIELLSFNAQPLMSLGHRDELMRIQGRKFLKSGDIDKLRDLALGYQNGLKTPHFCRCKKH
jgi:hypothetical protein